MIPAKDVLELWRDKRLDEPTLLAEALWSYAHYLKGEGLTTSEINDIGIYGLIADKLHDYNVLHGYNKIK